MKKKNRACGWFLSVCRVDKSGRVAVYMGFDVLRQKTPRAWLSYILILNRFLYNGLCVAAKGVIVVTFPGQKLHQRTVALIHLVLIHRLTCDTLYGSYTSRAHQLCPSVEVA